MLILTRRLGEKILIGSDITIQVTDITSERVKIGIDAPKDVDISRPDASCREPRGLKQSPEG